MKHALFGLKKATIYVFIVFLGGFFLLRAPDCLQSAAKGVRTCLDVVIPSQLCMETGASEALSVLFGKPLGKLLGLSPLAAQAMVLGFLGGYPVGARCAVSLYDAKKLSKEETEHLLSSCNNCGPSFIFGAVGAGVFGSGAIAAMLWASHIISAMLAGLILRPKERIAPVYGLRPQPENPAIGAAIAKAGISSFKAIGSICAFVILFNVVLLIPHTAGFYSLSENRIYHALLSGLLEMTNGVLSLRGTQGRAAVCCAAFLISWGGLSVHFQTLSVLAGRNLKTLHYFTGKFLQACISIPVTYLFAGALTSRVFETFYIAAGSNTLNITFASSALFALPWVSLLLLVLLLGNGADNSRR